MEFVYILPCITLFVGGIPVKSQEKGGGLVAGQPAAVNVHRQLPATCHCLVRMPGCLLPAGIEHCSGPALPFVDGVHLDAWINVPTVWCSSMRELRSLRPITTGLCSGNFCES